MAITHIPCSLESIFLFTHYGCWCGIGGGPYKPIDEFDEACKTHDGCYQDALDTGCSFWDEYIFSYKWHDENGKVRSQYHILKII